MLHIRVLFSTMLISIFSIQTMLSQIEKFQCATDQSSIQQVGQLLGTTWTLKVLLVEFSDVHHNTNPSYTYDNFDTLFFSTNVYVSPNMYSPDGEQVFGSMRDYYSIMSDGEFNLIGYVVNRDDNYDNIPDWLTLPLRKGQYDSSSYYTFTSATFAAANAAGLDVSTNSTTKLAIIYAGQTYRGEWDTVNHILSGLNPRALGSYYFNGEKFGSFSPYRAERPDAKFSEIGINAHEFGHLLGFPDLYDNGYWDMMNGGPYFGPNLRGACPAPLNPQTRYIKGWLSLSEITSNNTFQADYNLRDPEVFQIKNSTNAGNYWLIETRNFNSTMTIGSTITYDYNYYILRTFFANPANQGVLVWRVPSLTSHGTVLRADGKEWIGWPTISAGNPFPGTDNVEVLSPWSDSRTYPNWIPNTKPSTNVGMEIVSEGTGYYTIDFYKSNPENTSPSKPHDVVTTPNSTNQTITTWAANQDPDIYGYNIYREFYYGTTVVSVTKINSSILTSTSFTDNFTIPGGIPPGVVLYLRYKVEAVDYNINQNPVQKFSVKADGNSIGILPATISSNTTIYGQNLCLGNVTVNSGAMLTISQATVVRFASTTSLVVNGIINAQGNDDASRILFTSAAGTSLWNYIKITNGGSVFKYCTFEYASYPLNLDNATSGSMTLIDTCIFRNNTLGLRLYQSKANIKRCEIKNNAKGVYCYNNINIKFTGNRIHYNSEYGIQSLSSNLLEFYGNVIDTNGTPGRNYYHGLYTQNLDHISLGIPYQSWTGFNTIRFNSGHEVYAGSGSPTVVIANCSIHDTINCPNKEIYNYTGNPQLVTCGCFWDVDSCQYYGNVLLNQPHNYLPTFDGQTDANGPLGKMAEPAIPDSIPWIFDPRIPDVEKVKRCKDIIAKNPKSEETKTVLGWLYGIIRKDYVDNNLGEKDRFFDYLKGVKNKCGDTETGRLALRYMIVWKMLENDNAKVIQLSQDALKVMTGEDKKWVLVDLAFTYVHSGKMQEARNVLQELRTEYSQEQELITIINNDIIDVEGQIANGLFKLIEITEPLEVGITAPKEFGISQNYPNPFNPTTVISYQISAISNVSLKVYDILGREVETLVDEMKEVGYYSVTFDGSKFSSGIYFTRFVVKPNEGKPFVQTRKLLLMK